MMQNEHNRNRYHVVFCTNRKKCLPMFYQTITRNNRIPCVWNYHCILLETNTTSTKTVVFDMDSQLPFPYPLDRYLDRTFPSTMDYAAEDLEPVFRTVQASAYIENLSNDRSGKEFCDVANDWIAISPTYKEIGEVTSANLDQFSAPQKSQQDSLSKFGVILSKNEILEYSF